MFHFSKQFCSILLWWSIVHWFFIFCPSFPLFAVLFKTFSRIFCWVLWQLLLSQFETSISYLSPVICEAITDIIYALPFWVSCDNLRTLCSHFLRSSCGFPCNQSMHYFATFAFCFHFLVYVAFRDACYWRFCCAFGLWMLRTFLSLLLLIFIFFLRVILFSLLAKHFKVLFTSFVVHFVKPVIVVPLPGFADFLYWIFS